MLPQRGRSSCSVCGHTHMEIVADRCSPHFVKARSLVTSNCWPSRSSEARRDTVRRAKNEAAMLGAASSRLVVSSGLAGPQTPMQRRGGLVGPPTIPTSSTPSRPLPVAPLQQRTATAQGRAAPGASGGRPRQLCSPHQARPPAPAAGVRNRLRGRAAGSLPRRCALLHPAARPGARQPGARCNGGLRAGLARLFAARTVLPAVPSPLCLPAPATPSEQARGLPVLIRLDGLDASTLTASLAALDGHLATTCAACPAGGEALASLRELPQLSAYLERCLELAQEHKGLGPAPAVLLLQVRKERGGGVRGAHRVAPSGRSHRALAAPAPRASPWCLALPAGGEPAALQRGPVPARGLLPTLLPAPASRAGHGGRAAPRGLHAAGACRARPATGRPPAAACVSRHGWVGAGAGS